MARAERRLFHYIYKTTCFISGRYYIGMHSTDKFEDGYLGSGKQLWRSIKKYGVDNHRREVLEMCESRDSLRKREKELIDDKLLKDDMCMNICQGGEGGWDYINRYHLSPVANKNHPSYHLILKGAEKARKIMAEQGRIFGGRGSISFKGKHHRDDSKKAIGYANSKYKGMLNSQFGTMWIFNLIERKSIKIKKEKLQEWLDMGWTVGRKILW